MPQKRKLQAGWQDDNRSQSLIPPTLTYICTLVVDGAACTNARVVSIYPEANLYDNDGSTRWILYSDNVDTKWAITETYTSPVTVKTVTSRMLYCTASR